MLQTTKLLKHLKKKKNKSFFLIVFNSILASSAFCRLLLTFANSLDLDPDRQHVGPDPNRLTL